MGVMIIINVVTLVILEVILLKCLYMCMLKW